MIGATRRFEMSVALATLLLAITALWLSVPRMAHAQGWLDPAWQYRRAVTVANPGGTVLTDYQVRITLDASFDFALALSDGSDLRVTAIDGTTLLPYWKETWNPAGTQGLLWARLPSIPAGGTTVYLYYGNGAAGPASNGTTTFALFDDSLWTTTVAGNPVQTAGQPWWEANCTFPTVFEDTSFPERPRFHMLFDGHAAIGHAKGYTTSPDLVHWTEYDNGLSGSARINPIMGPGYTGNAAFAWGDVIKRGGVYHMFPSRGPGQTVHTQSTDLLHWSGFEALSAPQDGGGIGTGAAVLKEPDGITPVVVDGKYWMIYFHGGSPGSVYLASADTASDLLTWTTCCSATPILAPSTTWDVSGLWTPSFVRVDDTYYIYYEANSSTYGWSIGYAKGAAVSGGLPVRPDNVTWSKPALPAITAIHGWDTGGCTDPVLRRFDGTYYLFYTSNGAYTNGFATSTSPEGPWAQYSGGAGGVGWTKAGTPSVSNGILTLPSGAYLKSPVTYTPGVALGFRARYTNDPGTSKFAGFINAAAYPGLTVEASSFSPPSLPYALYLSSYDGSQFRTVSLGTPPGDFHVYEDAWVSSSLGRLFVDNSTTPSGTITVAAAVPDGPLPIEFYNYNDGTNAFGVDWMYLRAYVEPEPVATLVAEQGPYTLTTSASPPAGGSVDRDLPGPTYDSGTVVHLTAVPAAGYRFVGWSGSAGGSENPLAVTMDADKSITGEFASTSHTITASAGPGGSISPSGAVSVADGADQAFAIAPGGGYHITDVQVDGTSAGAVAGHTFTNVQADHTIAASFDVNPPVPAPALTAVQVRTGNGAANTCRIAVSWAALPAGSSMEVWRHGYGSYPGYDDAGSPPVKPADYPPTGWTRVDGLTNSGDTDGPGTRDYWYYVGYVTDAYGTRSAVSEMTAALDYFLGDVTNGASPGTGNNVVDGVDVSLLGANYGKTGSQVTPENDYLDVGPTSTHRPDGLPLTDRALQFEDLVIFALNFGGVSAPPAAAQPVAAAGADALVLERPEQVTRGAEATAKLTLRGSGALRAVSTALAWDPAVVEPVGHAAGEWLTAQNGVAFSARPGTVDAATLGSGLSGEGLLATVRFRALADGNPGIRLAAVDARDGANRRVTVATSERASGVPAVTELSFAQPNPSRGTATLSFSLARAGRVELAVYSVDGRRVRTLVDAAREAGVHRVTWDGTDDGGRPVAPGAFYVRLAADGRHFAKRLVYLR